MINNDQKIKNDFIEDCYGISFLISVLAMLCIYPFGRVGHEIRSARLANDFNTQLGNSLVAIVLSSPIPKKHLALSRSMTFIFISSYK